MRNEQESRDLMHQRIREANWAELFTGGACSFFALVLHEELELPLFYASPVDRNEFRHVFVMRGCECIDYLGKHRVQAIAKKFAEWPDVPPRPTTVSEVMGKIQDKKFGEDLEKQLFAIARAEFGRLKDRYS
jgi:hypothetical protein